MYQKILLAIMMFCLLPAAAWARAYLIVVDENFLKTPNYANNYNGMPLPVTEELKRYFNASVDVVGISLNAVNPLDRYISKNYDLIITVGYEVSEMGRKSALSNKRQNFALLDCYWGSSLPENALAYRFNTGIGAFLAGYTAAKVSERGHIAFIGGKKNLPTMNLAKCFGDGAKLANPGINLKTDYINACFNPRLGLSHANSLFNGKTDVIFHAAEYSGQGVLEAAQRARKWTIGLNTDLYPGLNRANILTSVTADYNMAIMEACMAVESGSFKGGANVLLTLSNHAVDLGDCANLPPEIMREVEQLKADILSGVVKVRDLNHKILK